MVRHQPKECSKAQRLLDDFIAGELSVESSREILQHLEHCHSCRDEQQLKEEVRQAIFQSWLEQPIAQGLEDRLRKNTLQSQLAPSGNWLRLAAGFVLLLAALYLAALFMPASWTALAVDHYHEVVQDHYRCQQIHDPMKKSLPASIQPTELKALEDTLRHVQGQAPLISAHLCLYGGVDFIHFVFESPQQKFSLILEERGRLERLAAADASQQNSVGAISVRLLEKDGASVACFESRDYFVYLVLNEVDPARSYNLAHTLFPSVRNSLEAL